MNSALLYLLSSLWFRIPAMWRRQESIEETSTRRTGGKGGEITIGREPSACPSHLAVAGLDFGLVGRICLGRKAARHPRSAVWEA